MTKILLSVLVILSLSACGRVQGGLGSLGVGQGSAKRATSEINGIRFRARTTAAKEDRRLFTVSVTPISPKPDLAKEAGRNAATRYCLLTFGGSDTDWISGPDAPISELVTDGNTLSMQGRCTQR